MQSPPPSWLEAISQMHNSIYLITGIMSALFRWFGSCGLVGGRVWPASIAHHPLPLFPFLPINYRFPFMTHCASEWHYQQRHPPHTQQK